MNQETITMTRSRRLKPAAALAAAVTLFGVWLALACAPVLASSPPPVVVTGSAADVGQTAELLTGTVNPTGIPITSCRFEYGATATYGHATHCSQSPSSIGAGTNPVPVSAEISLAGLMPGALYHFRLTASNASATGQGEDQTFAVFGFASFENSVTDHGGFLETQAGAHPYQMTTSFSFPTGSDGTLAADVKDLNVALPPGFVGDPTVAPKCTVPQLDVNDCPTAAQVGVVLAKAGSAGLRFDGVYNMVPPAGVPAMFAANAYFFNVYIEARVRTGADYGVTAFLSNITSDYPLESSTLTLWGVPADPSHDAQRLCEGLNSKTGCGAGIPRKPFLTNPTSCGGPQETTASIDSWKRPGEWVTASAFPFGERITGCSLLNFDPTIAVRPTTSFADSPTGLSLDLHVPQNENPEGLAEADLKNTVVTLPAGVTLNPAAANGLDGCSPAQIDLKRAEPANCPDASKVGTVEVETPLLEHPLKGAVYVATQNDNPFGSLLALYIAVDDPQTGVVVKLAGRVNPDPQTGRLTTTFQENPQLPFEDLRLAFFGGPRAALRTPSTCGTFTTTTDLMPWTSPAGVDATPSDSFQITSGANGAPCADSEAEQSDKSSFEAGTAVPIAGSYSPFALRLSREDGSQNFKGLDITMPPGLAGKLAGIPYCPQSAIEAAEARSVEGQGAAELASPSCPTASQIGTVDVGAGAGPDPIYVQGKAYLAGPYKGAPFSVAIITPAMAGPYDLGTVVVRAALEVNPNTAQITVRSDPIPTILDGIPLDVRDLRVAINRPQFTFNPTSCAPMTIDGTVTSTQGAQVAVSSRFQVGGCGELPFRPSFTVSTQGKTSKANGASLTVKLAQKPGEANIHKVNLQLPLALPSRLTTLQKACTEAQFSANPAGCPKGSNIGMATAVTPVLNVPLTGPAYLVSHGGAAFPDVEFVLQGEGVEIVLDGKTSIKKGITYSNFETVPDAPISSFETVLPEGPHSALAANKDLCATTKTVSVRKRVTVRVQGHTKRVTKTVKQTVAQPLLMPTTLVGQNGAVVHQTTKIAVTGCPKAKNARRAKRTSRHRKGKHNKH
jgi:hypothetical protein